MSNNEARTHYIPMAKTYTIKGGKHYMIKYYVKIDGRVFEFTESEEAMQFAEMAIYTITKKSWETEEPDIEIRLVYEEDPEETAEKLPEGVVSVEQLEEECEA